MLSKMPARRAIYFITVPALLLSYACTMRADSGPGAVVPAGLRIYRQQCAGCHGGNGEGAKAYPKPLTGIHSAGELAHFIAQAMPPGPRHCPAPEAQQVAAYIYDAFYSPLAQARNRPARIALARLTVPQFRNAVADLVGVYRPVVPSDARHGLQGEYFKGRDFNSKERVLERLDSAVQFDFGTTGPAPDQFDPHHFSVRWQGSVFAPDTGEYEFIVRTEHAIRLFVNGGSQPLIDAWVKSGADNEYHGAITLLGGRAYPLRLEFSKSTQGVDDSAQKKGKPAPKASIVLLWKRPKLAAEVIPQRYLYSITVPETFIVTTPFPPDDRSIGYERGDSVSKDWDEATTTAALETAHYVADHLKSLSGVPDSAPDRRDRLQAYCRQFVERAFHRPLTPDFQKFYIEKQFGIAPDLDIAVKRVVVLALKSPHFLYRELDSRQSAGSNGNSGRNSTNSTNAYDVASRLSFGLWDTLPDPELMRAAAAGELATREQVTRQAARMVADSRAWNKLRAFLLFWLKVDQTPELAKNPKKFADFDATVAADLRTSLELSLENVVWSENSDYRELMLTHTLYLNGRLAKLYGANLPADSDFQPVTVDPAERSGVLTHPYLLSTFAYLDTSSPIHRGVLIMRNLLGRTLRPPPAAFAPLAADVHPNMTTRQRVALQTQPAFCNGCHGMINPLGYTLERFDAIGRLRDHENGQPIDSSGSYRDRSGRLVSFAAAPDLGRYLAESDEAHAAFVEKLFQHLVKQPVLAYGPRTLPDLQRAFAEKRYNIRALMMEIMAATALMQDDGAGNRSTFAMKE